MAGKEEARGEEPTGRDNATSIADAIHDLADAIRTYARAISDDQLIAADPETSETYLDGTPKE